MSFQLSLEGWQRFSGNDVIWKRVQDSWGSDWEGLTANGSGRDRRHQDTVRVGGAECSTTRHSGDADEWPKVAWCTSMQHFERHTASLYWIPSLNVAGKWPARIERLKSSVINGAITSTICFSTEFGIGSAADDVPYGMTVLTATQQRWHFRLYLSQLQLVLNLATSEVCKAELTQTPIMTCLGALTRPNCKNPTIKPLTSTLDIP